MLLLLAGLSISAVGAAAAGTVPAAPFDLRALERDRVLRQAEAALAEAPLTITASSSPRSAGGPHDYFSEGDYWWPDPRDPGAPYVRRDGESNPANFEAHRRALRRLSRLLPALAAGWLLTGEARYAEHAAQHLRAWFIAPATRMSPHLRHAQAIHGRSTGRGVGIIDTIHLVEVARAIEVLAPAGGLSAAEGTLVRQWFADYLAWMTTSPNGIEERDAKNNHGTCFVMQAAAFAHLTGDEARLGWCRERFRSVLVPTQIAANGSLPLELARSKPYSYSLFGLEALAVTAELASTPGEDLWRFETADGRGLRRAVAWLVPYLRDKARWPFPPDVQYFDAWPMRQASLLFAGLALAEPSYLELWRTLPADSDVDEVVRNFFVRQPVLWVAPAP